MKITALFKMAKFGLFLDPTTLLKNYKKNYWPLTKSALLSAWEMFWSLHLLLLSVRQLAKDNSFHQFEHSPRHVQYRSPSSLLFQWDAILVHVNMLMKTTTRKLNDVIFDGAKTRTKASLEYKVEFLILPVYLTYIVGNNL